MRSLAAVLAASLCAAAQPADLEMYRRIRDEAFNKSRVTTFAQELMDRIGPRLTGSPNLTKATEWARQELTAIGCQNVRSESWGEFGIGWTQRNVWLRMTEPDSAVMIAQAAPWSPGTRGSVRGQVALFDAHTEKDLQEYRGKLAGKIVLFGTSPKLRTPDRPMFERLTEKELAEFATEPKPEQPPPYEQIFQFLDFRERIGRFLADEKVAAVLTTSPAAGGTTYIDSNYGFGWKVYRREHAMRVPVLVVAAEHYGRMGRLAYRGVPVTVELQVDVDTSGDHEEGFNTFADIPGKEPNRFVMVAAHLDSWASATGAADDGAGVVIAMEAMRILRSLNIRPKQTIRLALWTGEEQGVLGSRAWLTKYVAALPTEPSALIPEFLRKLSGPPQPKQLHGAISAILTLDAGGGKVRGISLSRNAALVPIFREWLEPLRDLDVTMVGMRSDCGGDCAAFEQAGIPTPSLKQDPLEYNSRSHHTNMDTLERLQAQDLRQAAAVVAILLYDMAMRDELLPRLPLR